MMIFKHQIIQEQMRMLVSSKISLSTQLFYNLIAKVETTGFSNIDQVINALMKMIPSIYPERTKFQFKITNLDKDQSQFYEHYK